MQASKSSLWLETSSQSLYERLSKFLLEHNFRRGQIDKTHFIKNKGEDFIIIQVYVDDIIFGATNDSLGKEFSNLMSKEFEMSMVSELTFFLGLQIKQFNDCIYVSQSKYVNELLKKFKMHEAKLASTPTATSTKLDQDLNGKSVNGKTYRGMIGSLLYF